MNNKVAIFDSTLRDGVQGVGINYSVYDKLAIIKILDEMGVDYIEAGNPGSNPRDREVFSELKKIKLKNSKIVSFGSTRRKNIDVKDDVGLKALLETETEVCCIFGKTSEFHVDNILKTTQEENLKMIEESCAFLKSHGKEVIFDGEHFFDGYTQNPDYAVKCLKAAVKGGADLLCLCDTNGGIFPEEAEKAVIALQNERGITVPIGVHFHNDSGMAVASSIRCVRAGISHVQGTLLGSGERCGNANLSTIIPNLQIKCGYECLPPEKIGFLTAYAKEIAAIGNTDLPKDMPFIGDSAFAHKAGMHAAGVLRNPLSFEHIDPLSVGNIRKFPASEISGKAIIAERIKQLVPEAEISEELVIKIIDEMKDLEKSGYQFEGADASFELLIRKSLGLYFPKFRLLNYKIFTGVGSEEDKYSATATVKIKVGEDVEITAADGNGPVNALDSATRKALGRFYPVLSEIKLSDYKVRVLESKDATAAYVRVLITSTDGKNSFTTVGVSHDVVKASWVALNDSIEYYLINA